jgi:hypothetical protein
MRLVWLVAVVFLGPLGLLAYLLSHQQPGRAPDPQAAMTNGRRTLGATVYSVAGYAVAMVLVHAILNVLPSIGNGPLGLAIMYGLPFIMGLLIFRAPLVASLMSDGYWGAVRRSLLAEVISVNLGLAGAIPVLLIPNSQYPLVFGPASPPTFGLFSLAAIASAAVIYPFNAWMVHCGLSIWPVRVVVGKAFAQEEDIIATPSLRNAWGALLLSTVLLIVSLGLTMLSLS